MQKIPGAKRADGTSLYRPHNFDHKIVRCTNPQSCWLDPKTNKILFSPLGETAGWKPLKLDCGSCMFCRLQRTREWALRCMHEAKSHDHKCFLTLTYAPEHLPVEGGAPTLVKKHVQDFLKRLRKRVDTKCKIKIRYFGCGEYGEQLSRPHYHLIIYGYDFPDKTLFRASQVKSMSLYRSQELEELWPFGHSTVGGVTYESAAYVASYCAKKINGKDKDEHYNGRQQEFVYMSKGRSYVDKETGEVIQTQGGIGYDFFKNYTNDIYNTDSCYLRDGVRVRVPRYYDKCLAKCDPERLASIKAARVLNAEQAAPTAVDAGVLSRTEHARKVIFNQRKRSYEKCPQPSKQFMQFETPQSVLTSLPVSLPTLEKP